MMGKRVGGVAERLPDVVRLLVLVGGILLSVYGAWMLDNAYPLAVQMEPFVGTPIAAWGTFWLGMGLAFAGFGLSPLSPRLGLSEQQRFGLLVSGGIVAAPALPAALGVSLGFWLMLLAVPCGLAGFVTTLVWWLGELILHNFRQ